MADEHAAIPGDDDWRIFVDLARLDEEVRGRVLRSYRDGAFRGDPSDAEDRSRCEDLDEALDRLMLLELKVEAGAPESTLPHSPALETLFRSQAFARYVNSYLSFGVRFTASRLLGKDSYKTIPRPASVARDKDDAKGPADVGRRNFVAMLWKRVTKWWNRPRPIPEEDFEVNELPFPLPNPPELRAAASTAAAIGGWSDLQDQGDDVRKALDFLDDAVEQKATEEGGCWSPADYERWLRGLGHNPAREGDYLEITRGLLTFVRSRVEFYTRLEAEGKHDVDSGRLCGRPRSRCAKHPLTARFGVLDLYWLARLLGAEVSSTGDVTYSGDSWMSLLVEHEPEGSDREKMEEAEAVLRAVFDFTCDLVQNAVAIATDALDRKQHPEKYPPSPKTTVLWRRAHDEELAEVARQRRARGFAGSARFAEEDADGVKEEDDSLVGWSRRVRTGEHLDHLVGLAFSGGGIRSATFNLGVLQRLQELDLLRSVDYLSTVSGGGYIGAWLLGNVRRTNYWLSQLTDWGPSIVHLRRFSNYLAPRTGIMSVDTWTMWASWVRNAFLIQVTALVWLAVLLVTVRLADAGFHWDGFDSLAVWPGNLVLALLVVPLTASVCINLRWRDHVVSERRVLVFAVAPVWLGSFFTAAMLWADRPLTALSYSDVFAHAWVPWFAPLLVMFVSLWILAACSIDRRSWQWLGGFFTAGAAIFAVYLGFCGVRWLFGQWSGTDRFEWFAFVLGPPLVLLAMALPIVFLIGLIGNASGDWRREWWTRFGSWLGISGVGFLGLSLLSVFGPLVTLGVLDWSSGPVEWGAVLAWIGTIAGGLLSGGGDKTTGEATRGKALAHELLPRVAAVVFIAGAVLLGSTGFHVLLVKVFTDLPVSSDLYWLHMAGITVGDYVRVFGIALALGLIFSWRFEINIFGLNQFYRNRLVRGYLGATRWRPGLRKPHKFTGFDAADDLYLSKLRNYAEAHPYRGPFAIVNGSLNLGGSSDLSLHTRHSASFVFTPLRAGADRKAVGYAPTSSVREPGIWKAVSEPPSSWGVSLGQAISVSGAAASPNMGYSTSPLVAFLLTMFNVRLAWWFPNPGRISWRRTKLPFSTVYLLQEMFGVADEKKRFVNVSDGGHFENLGIYELVRRRCTVIIASDAECDPKLTFGSLGNVIRLCETDFGAKIKIDVESIRKQKDEVVSRAHCAIGTIEYSNGSRGHLIYLKSSLSGDEDVSIEQYRDAHPDFPHETTADQFFSEDQFESYRLLGYHITRMTLRDVQQQPSLVEMADKLTDIWVPAAIGGDSFVSQAKALDEIWERFRENESLRQLLMELMGEPSAYPANVNPEELLVCMELFQLMENVFITLRLVDFWDHPDNRGWVALFTMWAKSGTFRTAWKRTRETFGKGFVYFCEQRLGLSSE